MIKVTYIAHSGFFAELDDRALLFDYWKGSVPHTDKPLYVFASHRHHDHFNKEIMSFDCKKIILSNDIRAVPTPNTVKLGANKSIEIDGMHIKTLRSTDEGVAFIVECGGLTLYHAGDLNDWYWEGEDEQWNAKMTENYRSIIKKGFADIDRVDIAFLPVDPRQGELCGRGADFFLDNVKTGAVFPMHFWEDYAAAKRYAQKRKERVFAASNTNECFDLKEMT